MNINQNYVIRGIVIKVYDVVETSTGDPRVDFVISQTDTNNKETFAYFSSFSGTALFVKKMKEGQCVDVTFDLRSFQNKANPEKYFTNLTCRRVSLLEFKGNEE